MLLPEESHAIQYLPRSCARGFETSFEIGVFFLELIDSFGVHSRTARRRIDGFDPRLRGLRATPERRELIAKVFY